MPMRLGAIALMLALTGCSAPPPGPEPVPSASVPEEEHNTRVSEANACQALAGPVVAVQASAAAPGPALAADTHQLLAMPDEADAVGLASFTPAAGGEWSLYLGREVFVIVRQANGTVVPGLKLAGPEGCEGLPTQRIYGLEAGATYQLEFGPTTARALAVVLTESHPGGAGEGAH